MNYLTLMMSAYLALTNMDRSMPIANETEWVDYKLQHGKSYESSEIDGYRRMLFSHHKQLVDKFHANAPEADMFQLELNKFADHGKFEMALLNGYRHPRDEQTGDPKKLVNSPEAQQFLDNILNDDSIEVPDEVDWRKVPGRVSKVKNQGRCGSCWAFSTTGSLEGQEKPRTATSNSSLTELSEQNLVDCVKADYGCNGGFMQDAMNYIKQEGGIDDEISYPYEATAKKCRFRKDKVAFTDAGGAILPVGDEQKLKETVAKFGPVSVAIDASSIWFSFYRRGVYIDNHCKNKDDQLDHGVLVVGYGTDPKKGDYWIVKNSWGASWGDHGYIKMARNRNNMCGIATAATIPTF